MKSVLSNLEAKIPNLKTKQIRESDSYVSGGFVFSEISKESKTSDFYITVDIYATEKAAADRLNESVASRSINYNEIVDVDGVKVFIWGKESTLESSLACRVGDAVVNVTQIKGGVDKQLKINILHKLLKELPR